MLHDRVHVREPEAGAALVRFRREERLEQARAHFVGHPRAGVGDCEEHVARTGRCKCSLIERVRSDANRDRAALRHRVARVLTQVHEHALDLAEVRHDRERLGCDFDDNAHVVPDEPPHHRQ